MRVFSKGVEGGIHERVSELGKGHSLIGMIGIQNIIIRIIIKDSIFELDLVEHYKGAFRLEYVDQS